MQASPHALGRLAERLSTEERQAVAQAVATLTLEGNTDSVAVRVARLSAMHGYAWSDVSNGSDVWAIVRGGHVVTVMLRRRTQPTDKRAFNVERVVLAA